MQNNKGEKGEKIKKEKRWQGKSKRRKRKERTKWMEETLQEEIKGRGERKR